MKFIYFLLLSCLFSFLTIASRTLAKEKLLEGLKKQLNEKNDYIELLEKYIKNSLFNHNDPQNPIQNKGVSFLQMQDEIRLKTKEQSQSGPVLKAMLFGFPNPRSFSFSSQNSKGEGKDLYKNMKVCEPGCLVV